MSTDPRTPEAGHGIGVIVAGDSSRSTGSTGPEPEPGTLAGAPPATAARRAGEDAAEALRSNPTASSLASLALAAAAGAVGLWLLQGRSKRP